MTNYEKRFENLANFLADTESMPSDAVIDELETVGVKLAEFTSEIKRIVGADEAPVVKRTCIANLATRSKRELLKLLEELESGPFGMLNNGTVPAAARTRELSRLSERELLARIERLQQNDSNHTSAASE